MSGFCQNAKKQSYKTGLMTGYQYLMSRNEYVKFKYSRSFSRQDGEYISIYKIYHPIKGNHTLTITATHSKNEQKVTVKT